MSAKVSSGLNTDWLSNKLGSSLKSGLVPLDSKREKALASSSQTSRLNG